MQTRSDDEPRRPSDAHATDAYATGARPSDGQPPGSARPGAGDETRVTERFYEEAYDLERPDAARGSHAPIRAAFKTILSMFTPNSGGTLLDVGCWDGYFTQLVMRRIGADEAHGVDVNARSLAMAEAKGIKARQVDINTRPLPYPDASFDVVVCSEVIEHVFSPDDLLAELRRVLRPSGYAVITTPNLAS